VEIKEYEGYIESFRIFDEFPRLRQDIESGLYKRGGVWLVFNEDLELEPRPSFTTYSIENLENNQTKLQSSL